MKFITGLMAGVIITLSATALAVNYARDIKPLNELVDSLEQRVKNLESLHYDNANGLPIGGNSYRQPQQRTEIYK